jgi:hypothetical protein
MNTEQAGIFLKQSYLIADKASGTTSASIVSMLIK